MARLWTAVLLSAIGTCFYFSNFVTAVLARLRSAPIGSGILYVKRDKIGRLWPIYGDEGPGAENIMKLNHTGTHPPHTDLGIENAIVFHDAIGVKRKEARLRYLQRYWTGKVRGTPKIVMYTPSDPSRSCAIANVGITGITPGALAKTLRDKYNVRTVAIDGAGVHGVRVTPHVYTSIAELDTFVRALKELAAA
jgi:selenocysteine lyase/cysteine desulfurase